MHKLYPSVKAKFDLAQYYCISKSGTPNCKLKNLNNNDKSEQKII